MMPRNSWFPCLASLILSALLLPCIAQTTTTSSPSTAAVKPILIGVVICTQVEPGDTASGSVVTDPQDYANTPGLQVVQATVPLATDAQGSASLSGVVIDTGDHKKQPAQGPLLLQIAQNATQIAMQVFTPGSDTPAAQETVPIAPPVSTDGTATPASPTATATSSTPPPATLTETSSTVPPRTPSPTTTPTETPSTTSTTTPTLENATPSDYNTPPIYTSGAVQVIHGPLSGNSQVTQVLMDSKPCNILAEDPRSVFMTPPQGTAPGLHVVTVKEGPRTLTTFHVAVVSLTLSADNLQLVDGQSTTIHATINGVDSLPAAAWKAGFEKDLISAKSLSADGIANDTWSPGKPGMIALHVVNNSADTVVLTDAKGNQLTQLLGRDSFSKGPYTYNGKVKSVHGGSFNINVTIVSLLAPIPGEAATD